MEEVGLKIISELSSSLEIDLAAKKSMEELRSALADYINYLITKDFDKLLRIIYKIDINEKLLRKKLEEEKVDAGSMIAEMIMEREMQKIETRKQFKEKGDIPENDKW